MTRKDDDKMGNREFEGYSKKEASYLSKVESRWTKEANAKTGPRGEQTRDIGKSHRTDGKGY